MELKTTLIRLSAALFVLTSAAAFAGVQVSTASSTVKVRPTDAPPANVPVELVAAKNEFVSFQVVLKADAQGAQNVQASLPQLTGAGTISGPNVTLYREDFLNLTQTSFPKAPLGRYPDPLVPDVDETVGEKRNAFPFSIPANESRAVWVDILVPKDAAPGIYEGAVHLTGTGIDESVPVKVSVLNTELPSTSSIATAFLFHRNLACQVHTGNSECGGEPQSYALRQKYQKMALEHRFTLSNTLSYPSNGDWATFDQRYSPWLDGTAPSRLPGAKMTSAQYPGQRDATQYKTFSDHFAEKGWLSRAYDYTGDEPPYGISFTEAKSRAELVKQAAPNLRTLLTTTVQGADENGLTQLLDLIVPVINYVDGVESPYIGDQRAAYNPFLADPANNLWLYQSCMSHGCAYGSNDPTNNGSSGWPSYMVDASAARNRAMQWLVFLEHAQGELYYETALALDTAWDSVFRFNGNGDGTLFYPGLPSRIGGTTDVPLPSLRMKEIRQGMQDYEWLKKVADAGDAAFAEKIARQVVPAASRVTDDGAAFDTARRQLISRWLELQPHDPKNPPVLADPNFPSATLPVENTGSRTEDTNGDGVIDGMDAPKKPGFIVGKLGCSAGGPELAGVLGLLGLALALKRRR